MPVGEEPRSRMLGFGPHEALGSAERARRQGRRSRSLRLVCVRSCLGMLSDTRRWSQRWKQRRCGAPNFADSALAHSVPVVGHFRDFSTFARDVLLSSPVRRLLPFGLHYLLARQARRGRASARDFDEHCDSSASVFDWKEALGDHCRRCDGLRLCRGPDRNWIRELP